MTADEFQSLLDATGLTLVQAAERLGVATSTAGRWARAETPIAAEKAAIIRERLGGDNPSN